MPAVNGAVQPEAMLNAPQTQTIGGVTINQTA